MRNGILISLAIALAATSCSGTDNGRRVSDVELVTVGDSTLTYYDVLSRMPANVQPSDSAAMFANIVESWMQDALLREIAEENLVDSEKIDRMVREYRTRLIINEYIKRMQQGKSTPATEAQVKEYYDAHSGDMRLEQPLVKGIYIKVAADAGNLDDLRRWMRSASPSSIDKIEKYGLKGAMHYDYFCDRWIDWQEIASSIPYRFGNADDFLAAHRNFETTVNGATYLLHITEVLPAGEVMPFDFAAPQIREAITHKSRADYAGKLLLEFAEKARADGRLSTPGYDVKTHKMTVPKEDAEAHDSKKKQEI